MRFSSAISTATELDEACAAAAADARAGMQGVSTDVCFAFFSASYQNLEAAGVLIAEHTGAARVIGCSGAGVVGGGREVETERAVSLTLASLPRCTLHTAHVEHADLPSPDAPPDSWADRVGSPRDDTRALVVLADPFSIAVPQLLAGLDFAYPEAPVIGGLASGSRVAGGHALAIDRRVARAGAAVLAVRGAAVVEARVAQGCKPFGKVGRITRCEGHELIEIDRVPAGKFLHAQLDGLGARDLELARSAPLFLGIAMDPFAASPPAAGDYLLRFITDYDERSRRLRVAGELGTGKAVQFHLRDADASHSDLEQVLAEARTSPAGALMFSCTGRGQKFYGDADHDSRVFHSRFAGTPLGGFFCNGEIGPVGGTTHLHGYTSSFALFSPAQ